MRKLFGVSTPPVSATYSVPSKVLAAAAFMTFLRRIAGVAPPADDACFRHAARAA